MSLIVYWPLVVAVLVSGHTGYKLTLLAVLYVRPLTLDWLDANTDAPDWLVSTSPSRSLAGWSLVIPVTI